MPRRRHRGGGNPGAAALPDSDGDGQGERTERIAVFERTKMCKFHILGVCSKGQMCRFAHDRTELQALPDLQRTKLCKTLISTGECNNPVCRYAHNKEELRPLPASSATPPTTMKPQSRQEALSADSVASEADPAAPNAVLQQAAFDTAMQAALLQVGQAAQAHAVEAARLQALATQLQMGALTPAALCGTADCFNMVGTAVGIPMASKALTQHLCQAPAPADPVTHDLLLGLGNTSEAADGRGAWRPEQPNRTAPEMAGSTREQGGSDGWASAMSRVLGDEPVQILPETLRSLSSSSLSLLAGGLDDDETPPSPEGATSPSRTASNTQVGCWRQGHLLGSVAEETNMQGFETRSQAGSCRGHDLQRSKEGSLDEAPDPSSSSSTVAAFPEGEPSTEDDHRLLSMQTWSSDTLSASGITVKNTFLDFKPRETFSGLRAVQTAAGRLDLMCQE